GDVAHEGNRLDGPRAGENIADGGGVLLDVIHAVIEVFVQIHLHDDGLDDDLGQDHVELVDNVRDGDEILFAGENEKRVGAFVGDDLRLAKNVNVAGAAGGGAIDDLVQPLGERAAAAGAARAARTAEAAEA